MRIARDFDAFYEERERPANDAVTDTTLLVLSTDAKGVRMLPRALREATRKAAAREAASTVRGFVHKPDLSAAALDAVLG